MFITVAGEKKEYKDGLTLPELIAAEVTVISYKWKHNTLFSIVAGTVCNVLLRSM